jgi:hypothetical protein
MSYQSGACSSRHIEFGLGTRAFVKWGARGFAILALASSFAGVSTALAGEVSEARVKTVAVFREQHPGLVLVQVTGEKVGVMNCHTNTYWQFTLRIVNDDDKRMFAMLTAAQLSQSRVRLVGKQTCDPSAPNVESLEQVWLQ